MAVMGFCLCFLCFLVTPEVRAQKRSFRTFDSASLTKVYVEADNVFEVVLKEHQGSELEVAVDIEGEYQSEMLLGTRREGNTLYLKGVFSPSFEDPNDKLSAHKVLSVRLELRVPAHLVVALTGLATRVVAHGYFEDLNIRTANGPVFLERPEGRVQVRTIGGSIRVLGASGSVTALSSYGKVVKGRVPKGISTLELHTVNGDIYLNKEE